MTAWKPEFSAAEARESLGLPDGFDSERGDVPGGKPVVEVRRDGKVQETFSTGDLTADQNAAWRYILKSQGMSVDWAMRYEGWSVDEVPGAPE